MRNWLCRMVCQKDIVQEGIILSVRYLFVYNIRYSIGKRKGKNGKGFDNCIITD